MARCKVCGKDLGIHHADVWACPNCNYIDDAQQLLNLLEDLNIDKKLRKKVEKEIENLRKKSETFHPIFRGDYE